MATYNTTAADKIIKVRYIGTIREQLNNATVLYNKIGKKIQSVSGKSFTVPLHIGRNTAAGSGRAEDGALPDAINQTHETTIVPVKQIYTSGKISGLNMAVTRDNAGAFADALEVVVEGMTKDTIKSLNRQLNSDGTDALAFWTTADNTTPATVDDNKGNGFTHLEVGSTYYCDLVDTDNSTLNGTNVPILAGAKTSTSQSVSWASGTIASSGDGDYLVLTGTLGKQLMGIKGIINNVDPPLGDLQGLDSTTYPWWQAQVSSNSGTLRQMTIEGMQSVIDEIVTNSSYQDSDVQFLYGNLAVRRAYGKLCSVDRRTVNTMELDGGWKGLEFSGRPFIVDHQAERNAIRFINPDTMQIFQVADLDFMDKDGSRMARVSGYDQYEMTLFMYANLACLSRNGNGLYADLLEA